jgi:hypothetical protein
MNYIICLLALFTCVQTQIFGMYTTFYRPTYWPEKPRFDRMNMTSYELTYFHGWASKSFNKDGERVPLLAFSNPEPLLPSFLEFKGPCKYSKPVKDNKPISYAIFDGQYSTDVIINEIVQNFHKHFFVQINVPIGQEHLKSISIKPTDARGNSINPDQKINSYIEQLSSKIFDESCTKVQTRSFVGPSFLLFGFAKTFNNFNHLDLLDFEFKTGFVVPIFILSKPDFSIFPRTDLRNFGIPFQFKFMLGAYDWLNFGVATAVVLHLKADDLFDVNENPYPNNFLIPTSKMASMLNQPFITFTTYFEGEHFLPYWTWYVGFDFVKQYKTEWEICGGTPCENQIANKFSPLIPWQQGNIILSSEIDFSKEEKKCMPRLKIIYAKRIFGKSCFDTSIFGGQVGFEILYDF